MSAAVAGIRGAAFAEQTSALAPLTLLSTDEIDPLYRLRVEVEHPDAPPDERGLVTVIEEELTSRAPTAQVTRVRNAIDLTPEQARWLYAALGRVIGEGAS